MQKIVESFWGPLTNHDLARFLFLILASLDWRQRDRGHCSFLPIGPIGSTWIEKSTWASFRLLRNSSFTETSDGAKMPWLPNIEGWIEPQLALRAFKSSQLDLRPPPTSTSSQPLPPELVELLTSFVLHSQFFETAAKNYSIDLVDFTDSLRSGSK